MVMADPQPLIEAVSVFIYIAGGAIFVLPVIDTVKDWIRGRNSTGIGVK